MDPTPEDLAAWNEQWDVLQREWAEMNRSAEVLSLQNGQMQA